MSLPETVALSSDLAAVVEHLASVPWWQRVADGLLPRPRAAATVTVHPIHFSFKNGKLEEHPDLLGLGSFQVGNSTSIIDVTDEAFRFWDKGEAPCRAWSSGRSDGVVDDFVFHYQDLCVYKKTETGKYEKIDKLPASGEAYVGPRIMQDDNSLRRVSVIFGNTFWFAFVDSNSHCDQILNRAHRKLRCTADDMVLVHDRKLFGAGTLASVSGTCARQEAVVLEMMTRAAADALASQQASAGSFSMSWACMELLWRALSFFAFLNGEVILNDRENERERESESERVSE